MRRTVYTDKSLKNNCRKVIDPPAYINRQESFKCRGKAAANLLALSDKHPYYLRSNGGRPLIRRPMSVNRTYSDFKHQNENKPISMLVNSTNQDFPVVTGEEQGRSRSQQRDELSRGKIYRGSSWKYQEKVRASDRDRVCTTSKDKGETETRGRVGPTSWDRVWANNRYSRQQIMQNTHSVTKSQRTPQKQSARHSRIFDLIGKNVSGRKSVQSQREDDCFDYVMQFSYRTKKGVIPSNPDKVNQDAYILAPNVQGKDWQHLFAVCDGHGPLGHQVSAYIKKILPGAVTESIDRETKPADSLMKAFETSYQKMIKHSKIDLSFSGSTIVCCYMAYNKIYCSNVGDSRAIVGRRNNKKWQVVPLSQDHKPCLPREAERINKMNGRIGSFRNQLNESIGPLRVWVKGENYPGLAMTRSFGDLVGASVGVSPVPQIKQFSLTNQDRIILIASDGVFEFLSNEQIIDSLSHYYEKQEIQQASDHLLSLAHKSWSRSSSIVDDITFILIFLDYKNC